MSRDSWLRPPIGVSQRAHLRRVCEQLIHDAAAAERAGDAAGTLLCLRKALRAERELERLDCTK